MKIDYEFTVGVPVDQAWNRTLDLEKIAPCLPKAAIQEEVDDGRAQMLLPREGEELRSVTASTPAP